MDSEHRLGLGLGRLGGAYGYIRTLSFVRYLVSSHRSILLASRLLPDRDYSPEDDRVPRCDLFSYVSHTSQVRSVRRTYFTAFLATRRYVRTSSTRYDQSKASFVRTTFHAAIHRTLLSGEIGCIVNALRESVLADGTHRKRGCAVCSVCVCRTKRATSRVTTTKQIPQARVDIQLARNYRIVNSLSGFSR